MDMDATLTLSVYDDLVILGVTALAISHVYRIFNLFWFYFLRPSSVKRYLHGSGPYAVVTGARHGTGKATAAELLRRGFNFMVHGRNEANMQRVVEELGASVTMDIRYFIADVSKGDHEWKRLLEPFGELHITVVVHNVGGEPLVDTRINTHRETYLLGVVRATALFVLAPSPPISEVLPSRDLSRTS